MTRAIPYPTLETVFLDAGNTLVHMDFAFLSEGFAALGFPCERDALARAESASRRSLSDYAGAGHSTETRETRRFWIGEVLGHLAKSTGAKLAELDTGLIEALLAWFEDHGVQRQIWSRVPDDVPAALTALRTAGFGLVVVSNSNGTIERGLEGLGLRDLFDAVVDSGVIGIEKPEPGIFHHALKLARGTPERCLHIGDLYSVDVVGARAAGLHAVLVDPYDDHQDLDCERFPSVAALAHRLLESRP